MMIQSGYFNNHQPFNPFVMVLDYDPNRTESFQSGWDHEQRVVQLPKMPHAENNPCNILI